MAGTTTVSYVGWHLASEDEILRQSHAAVSSHELFAPGGQPVPGGVYDLRLGTTDHSWLCLSCSQGKKLCPGHRGHLALRVGVVQPVGVPEVRRWLRVVCLQCSEVVANREKWAAFPPGRRLHEAAAQATEGVACPRCGAVHPRIVKDDEDHFTFLAVSGGKTARTASGRLERQGEKLYPDAIRAIFERIPDRVVEELGRAAEAHPRHLVLRVLNVPPNAIRPNVRSFGGGGASYHDSTNLLQHIARRNALLPERLPAAVTTVGSGEPVDGALDRAITNMQQLVYDLIMGSSSTSVTQGAAGKRGLVMGSRPVHSFMRNLPRKEGRIRMHLLGKRVYFISRTTISGNMRLRIDEVGIPLDFARTLQVEETVQEFNREWLLTFFLNGRRQYPGCTQVVKRATGEVHDVAGLRDFRLEVGDVLFRDVVTGDAAFFNRQPTLERSSIGVHRVIVIQDPGVHTFQMNVLACENYNADFDGDQMLLWVARSPAARAEAVILSSVANSFISTKSSGPVNGQVQDSVVGCNELTRARVRVGKFHAMGLFASAGVEPPRFDLRPAAEAYTGREIVSLLFAATPFYYSRPPSSYSEIYAPHIPFDPSETHTLVVGGQMKSGVLDKRSIAAKATGGFFHLISREYGSQRALDMIFALQQIALQFLMWQGFTCGTGDLLPDPAALARVRDLVALVGLESRIISDRLVRGEVVPPIGSTVHEFYERSQIATLKVNEAEILREILSSIRPDTNGLFRMVSAGSKGTNAHFIHIIGAIGQTTINGERIREQFAFKRTSPYFARFTTDPAAYGFVMNAYMNGMLASEFIFQMMNGRFDLISKALSTAVSGYFMRKGVMNNQSSIVDNHRRVTKDTRIVQFIYGEDGLDSRELERVSFAHVLLSDKAIHERFGLGADAAAAEAVRHILADRDMYRRAFCRVDNTTFGRSSFPTDLLLPVNVGRIVAGTLAQTAAGDSGPVPGVEARIARVADLVARMPYLLLNEAQERRRGPVPPHKSAAVCLMQMSIRAELCPRVLAGMLDAQLDFIVDAVRQRYRMSLIDYGTAAGILAAQAISEPLTQYMLDSHHRSVGAGTNKSGLTRVAEIYGAKSVEDEQSPTMQLPIRPEALGDPAGAFLAAQEIANSIEYVTLRRFTRQYDVVLEPYGGLRHPQWRGDQAWIAEFERNHPLVAPPGDLTNWCFRFLLDKSALVLKAVELDHIVRRLRARHPGLFVVHSAEASPEVVIRVWNRASQFRKGSSDDARVATLVEEVLATPVRGIRGIMQATAERYERYVVDTDGALVLAADRYAIVTQGTNLYMAALHPAIDASRIISSSVGDTLRMFGIEAARSKIISETRGFMSDNAPNLRHLFMYADEMTRTGKVTSVERGGLGSREHSNVLLRMAYGAPIQVVMDAAFACARTKVYGIAGPQLLGSTPQIGTCYNTLVMDDKFIQENTKTVDMVLDML